MPNRDNVLVGLVFVVVGLSLFVQRLETGLVPLGDATA
ncbi:MAG: DUF1538 family protein [Kiloniellaceae bacterium]